MSSHAHALSDDPWPALPLDAWEPTRATLHRWMQIVGKTRLALAPMQNHWWQVTLYASARGMVTTPMPYGERTIEVELDFIDHRLIARTSDGGVAALPLVPLSVADFYAEYRKLLRSLGVQLRIWTHPVEIADAQPFPLDRQHAAYDADAAHRFWRIVAQTDRVLKGFRGGFLGKCSPVHFWWGSFDLACTRFSGRLAPRHPGGIPNMSDAVTREAYSHECISVGWWPGGAPVLEPAFYAYAYPEPAGCPEATIRPAAAGYHLGLRQWILPYEAVRLAKDRDAAILEFARSTYDVAADLGGWDRAALERRQGR